MQNSVRVEVLDSKAHFDEETPNLFLGQMSPHLLFQKMDKYFLWFTWWLHIVSLKWILLNYLTNRVWERFAKRSGTFQLKLVWRWSNRWHFAFQFITLLCYMFSALFLFITGGCILFTVPPEIEWFIISHNFSVMFRVFKLFTIHKQGHIFSTESSEHTGNGRHMYIIQSELYLKNK